MFQTKDPFSPMGAKPVALSSSMWRGEEPAGDTPREMLQVSGNIEEDRGSDKNRWILSLGTYPYLDGPPGLA